MDLSKEWLETDGLGGFAMGTAAGIRTRRYHALLQPAATPPTGRVTLVNGFDAWVQTAQGTYFLTSQKYSPNIIHPDGSGHIESFDYEPWPKWTYRFPNGLRLEQEIFVPKGSPAVAISWKLLGPFRPTKLVMRPFISGRDYHGSHHENPSFQFKSVQMDSRVIWQPYPGLPPIAAVTNGSYQDAPQWYRNFLYDQEFARGLDDTEDLASPGEFSWELQDGEAVMIFSAEGIEGEPLPAAASPLAMLSQLRKSERKRRDHFPTRWHRSADDYLVSRGKGKTVIAGYPWFTDWGRDTFIAMRGLCLATGRLDEAGKILMEWSGAVSEGMLPNLFTDAGQRPEYNSIDASLWYVVAVQEYLERSAEKGRKVSPSDKNRLKKAVEAILTGYKNGTRYNIHMDSDGLIMGGQPGLALTWMDARVNGRPITPRIGKPVEVQALWLNAVKFAAEFSKSWEPIFQKGLKSFEKKFWNKEKECLNDVVDVDHASGAVDASFRPNQILAVGGLPVALITGERAQKITTAVEKNLWTPLGLRSLAPGEPGYAAHYEGGPSQRDSVYHQGTVWPWLIGPFVEAWLKQNKKTPKAVREAREKFLKPLQEHLQQAGLGHVSEITDAEAPFTPRGCPFQAWSVGEMARLDLSVLKEIRNVQDQGTPALTR